MERILIGPDPRERIAELAAMGSAVVEPPSDTRPVAPLVVGGHPPPAPRRDSVMLLGRVGEVHFATTPHWPVTAILSRGSADHVDYGQ